MGRHDVDMTVDCNGCKKTFNYTLKCKNCYSSETIMICPHCSYNEVR